MGQVGSLRTDCQSVHPGASPDAPKHDDTTPGVSQGMHAGFPKTYDSTASRSKNFNSK